MYSLVQVGTTDYLDLKDLENESTAAPNTNSRALQELCGFPVLRCFCCFILGVFSYFGRV